MADRIEQLKMLWSKSWTVPSPTKFSNQRNGNIDTFGPGEITLQVEETHADYAYVRGKYPRDAYFASLKIADLVEMKTCFSSQDAPVPDCSKDCKLWKPCRAATFKKHEDAEKDCEENDWSENWRFQDSTGRSVFRA